MEKIKSDVSKFVGNVVKKGSVWFSRLINSTDHALSEVSYFLKLKKEQLEDYLVDRERLLERIQLVQIEVV